MRALVVVSALALLAAGCPEPKTAPKDPSAAHTAPGPQDAVAEDVPLPRVHDENKSLLYYFLDERGAVKTVSRPEEVPPAVRSRVLVVDVSQSPEERQAHRYNFFADLTTRDDDGSYAVIAVSRYDAAKGEGLKGTLPPVPEGSVIVYSAEWCGFCKKAKAWLAERDVPFLERDVEKQAGVADELEGKLKQANLKGGGVPVIDWSGTVVMGFDKKRLESLLEKQRSQKGEAAPPGH